MTKHFTKQFFIDNRAALRTNIGTDETIVIPANGLLQRTADTTFTFQQDSNFWYLSGIEEPDILLVIEATNTYLIVPGRDSVRSTFDGVVDVSKLQRTSGIQTILDERTGWERLRTNLQQQKAVWLPLPAKPYEAAHGMYRNPAALRLIARLKRSIPNIHMSDIRPVLANLRVIKQPAEITAIQSAIDITSATLTDIRSRLTSYSYEYQVEADISQGFRFRGARGHSFAPIVASGKNATVLHNVANEDPLQTASLTVLDIGAEVDHYAADITRTVTVSHPSVRQTAIYEAVLAVQEFALQQLRPGILPRDYETAIAQEMGKHLKALKLIDTIDHNSVRKYFPHSTSHFLGLDVHDVGDYSLPLQIGMVITCEPGIYIPEEGIGVRIEDDVLITATGNQVLSQNCTRSLTSV